MSITSRAAIRAELSGLFDDITALEQNLVYPPLALEGKSPVLYIQSAGTAAEMLSRDVNQIDHLFVVTIAVNRERHGGQAAEDVLDAIWTAVVQAVRATPTGTNYMNLSLDSQRSKPYFATVDGIGYRFEELFIMARSNING